jgi:hypothetical protein
MESFDTVKVTEWLEKTQKGDVAIEKFIDGKWQHDRYMRTCTTTTGLQELVVYRKQHGSYNIRLVGETEKPFVVHYAEKTLKWC